METAKMILLLVATCALLAVLTYLTLKKEALQAPTSYTRRRPLSSYEQAMYWRLIRTLPEYVVLAQVAMRRCIGTKGPELATIAHENLDFVVCNKAMHIIAVLEIENSDHSVSEYRQKTDRIKKEALEKAGIKLIQCSSNALLSEARIAMEFQDGALIPPRLAA
jgi:hypothetical protein